MVQQSKHKIIIPGRPQAHRANDRGKLHAAEEYLQALRRVAGALGNPRHPSGSIAIHIDLYYAVKDENDALDPAQWHRASVPRGDTAAQLVLTGLAGRLIAHAGQANPLTVQRHISTARACQARFGNPHGATIITWQDPEEEEQI